MGTAPLVPMFRAAQTPRLSCRINRTRLSSNASTTAEVSSLEPSSTTTASQCG